MEKALLVTTKLKKDKFAWEIDEAKEELSELVLSSGAEVKGHLYCIIERPSPALYIGRGKAEEIARVSQEANIDVVVFDNELSSSQQRNLEEIINIKTIDRTQLILDIFAQHARSIEGKLQVELAQLEYLLPRLAGKGIILSRLGGGIGTRGPGEQKLEVDRRRIHKRIMKLKADLKKIRARRSALRKKRRELEIPTVALIGYTNAGKTTLLNALTEAEELVRDSLFSTLDSKVRRFILPNNQKILFLDTVGFLQRLPHHLIEAFKATLEEVVEADILIHVLDIAQPLASKKAEAVYGVLGELGLKDKFIITALNKIDKIKDFSLLERQLKYYENSVLISALEKKGLEDLVKKIMFYLEERIRDLEIFIPNHQMRLLHLIYEEGRVLKKEYQDSGVYIKARLPKALREKIISSARDSHRF